MQFHTRRIVVLVVGMVLGTVIAGWQPREAFACSGPPFSFEYLAGTVHLSDVVAIGTLRGNDGATIGLDVETYYKAPEGRPPRLIVNNLRQEGWPNCLSTPLRMRMFDEGTQVLAFLKVDDQGIGARWRGAMLQGSGIMPLQDGRVVHLEMGTEHFERHVATRAEFDARMAESGFAASKPDASASGELPLVPTSPLTCLYDPPTIQSLTAEATLVGVGVVVERTPDVVTFRVDEPLKGATGTTTVRVNNHHFTGGLSDCNEQVGSGKRIWDDRGPVLLFLAKDTSGVGAEWRPTGIDAAGLFLSGDIPWKNAEGTGPLSFDAVGTEVLKFAAVAPQEPQPVPVTPRRDASGGQPWLWTAIALSAVAATAGGLTFLRLRRR